MLVGASEVAPVCDEAPDVKMLWELGLADTKAWPAPKRVPLLALIENRKLLTAVNALVKLEGFFFP
jgi:hypothetical protein